MYQWIKNKRNEMYCGQRDIMIVKSAFDFAHNRNSYEVPLCCEKTMNGLSYAIAVFHSFNEYLDFIEDGVLK